MGAANSRLIRDLQERKKELHCVYGISRICDIPGASLEVVVQQIADLLPASWQYPALACARIILRGEPFKTRNFSSPRYRQQAPIIVRRRRSGFVEVGYLRKPHRGPGRPFLDAERKLLNVVAERLGKIVEQKDSEQELKASQEHLRRLLRRVESALEDERKRIAHELHDELGHALMAIRIDLASLRDGQAGETAFLEKTRAMDAFINTTTQNLQRIAWELRPVLLDEFGLPAAVASLAREFEKRYGILCGARISADLGEVDRGMALALYRIIQELLTNVARHAMATRVMIQLNRIGSGLRLKVEDNGRGISEKAWSEKKSLGLVGIRERVHGFGGALQIQGRPRRGTVAMITLPLEFAGEDR